MGADLSSCSCGGSNGATLEAYAALLAGDPDYEWTLYGVRKTEAAVIRGLLRRQDELRYSVAQRETQCARMHAELARAHASATQNAYEARTAAGGIDSVEARLALARAKTDMTQMANITVALRQEYSRMEMGRKMVEHLETRLSVNENRAYLDQIRTAANEAALPEEQITYLQTAGEETMEKFEDLVEQQGEFNVTMDALGEAVAQNASANTTAIFGEFDLNDPNALFAALASMQGTSYDASLAAAAAPLPPQPVRKQYDSYAALVQQPSQQNSTSSSLSLPLPPVPQQNLVSRSMHSQSKLPRAPMDERMAAVLF